VLDPEEGDDLTAWIAAQRGKRVLTPLGLEVITASIWNRSR